MITTEAIMLMLKVGCIEILWLAEISTCASAAAAAFHTLVKNVQVQDVRNSVDTLFLLNEA